VVSLNRPGGNITGITFINSQLGPKRIQLLRLLNPKTMVIAVLVNPENPNAADAKNFEAAGRSIGVQIVIVNASTDAELKEAFTRALEQRADALLVHVDALFNDKGVSDCCLSVENDESRAAKYRACKPDPLTLTTREANAAVANPSVVALRHMLNHLVHERSRRLSSSPLRPALPTESTASKQHSLNHLLRARRAAMQRPCRRARDELASSDHSITSSARTRTLAGSVKPSPAAAFWLTMISNAVAC
jgi:ABC transporter substrate binding protein